ncbi:MAG TPA: ester cyclase [Baekduia sp.]|uniref:ester cyclase n=1 Tax=Baekduia sp. TaxID=2600305 RepID=UPI002D78733C|nr:ester cyclase [Baekduia sp.]HET6509695.1 ester cyclase [Baekduia sp.]
MDPKTLVRTYVERVWNGGDAAAVDELVAEDYVAHDPADPAPVRGREALKALVRGYRASFPDLVNTIHAQVAEGDLVATRWSSTGTHQGPAFGLEATGHRRDVTGMMFIRIQGGQVAEEWHNWDTIGLLRQLGGLPAGTPGTPGTEA